MECTQDGYLIGRFSGKKYVIEIDPADEELVHIFRKRKRGLIPQRPIVYPLRAEEYLPRFTTRRGVDIVARELVRIENEKEWENQFADFPSEYTLEQVNEEGRALEEAIRALEQEEEESV